MKFVSTMTLYGGPSAELCLKKSAEEVASLLGEDGGKGGQRGKIRASRRQARERETHMCFTSGSSSRFFFVFLPLSTRASLGFSTRLTSANFLVFVLFLPMAPYPTLVPWSSVPRRRHFRDDGRANDSTDASSTR